MNVLQTENSIDSYSGEPNFFSKRRIEQVSESTPLSHKNNPFNHPINLIETENEDESKSDFNDCLKLKDSFSTIFYFPPTLRNLNLIEHSNYHIAEEATLPTSHFLYLEIQVIRI